MAKTISKQQAKAASSVLAKYAAQEGKIAAVKGSKFAKKTATKVKSLLGQFKKKLF